MALGWALAAGEWDPHRRSQRGLAHGFQWGLVSDAEESSLVSRRAGRAELLLDGGEAEAAVGDGEARDGGWRCTGGTWRDRAPREGGEGADQGPGMPDPVKNNGGRQRPRTTARCSTPPVLINRERERYEKEQGKTNIRRWKGSRARGAGLIRRRCSGEAVDGGGARGRGEEADAARQGIEGIHRRTSSGGSSHPWGRRLGAGCWFGQLGQGCSCCI